MKYTEVTAAGEIVGWGDCLAVDVPHASARLTVLPGVHPPFDRNRIWRWDGKAFVDAGPRFPDTYVTRRLRAYPGVPEQLDLLWHAMDAGTTPPIEPWYSTIKAIKDAHPKP